MQAVIVYESMFGNTRSVAEAIGRGLSPAVDVRIGSTEELSGQDLTGADLLIVGGPTHMHGMVSSASRKAASQQADDDPELDLDDSIGGPVLRDWLAKLPAGEGRLCAAFDTRVDKPALLTGSAAKGIAKRLRKRRFEPIAEAESFFIDDTGGPLHDGEVGRARSWGQELATRLAAQSTAV